MDNGKTFSWKHYLKKASVENVKIAEFTNRFSSLYVNKNNEM